MRSVVCIMHALEILHSFIVKWLANVAKHNNQITKRTKWNTHNHSTRTSQHKSSISRCFSSVIYFSILLWIFFTFLLSSFFFVVVVVSFVATKQIILWDFTSVLRIFRFCVLGPNSKNNLKKESKCKTKYAEKHSVHTCETNKVSKNQSQNHARAFFSLCFQ